MQLGPRKPSGLLSTEPQMQQGHQPAPASPPRQAVHVSARPASAAPQLEHPSSGKGPMTVTDGLTCLQISIQPHRVASVHGLSSCCLSCRRLTS